MDWTQSEWFARWLELAGGKRNCRRLVFFRKYKSPSTASKLMGQAYHNSYSHIFSPPRYDRPTIRTHAVAR